MCVFWLFKFCHYFECDRCIAQYFIYVSILLVVFVNVYSIFRVHVSVFCVLYSNHFLLTVFPVHPTVIRIAHLQAASQMYLLAHCIVCTYQMRAFATLKCYSQWTRQRKVDEPVSQASKWVIAVCFNIIQSVSDELRVRSSQNSQIKMEEVVRERKIFRKKRERNGLVFIIPFL